MKKHFLLATMGVLIAGLCGICSCTAVREEAPQEGLFAEDVLCYVTTEDGVVTKTVNNGSATLWADGDQLTAINISDGADSYSYGHLSYRGNNTFGGRLNYSGDVNDWYVVYPHRDDNKTPHNIHISVSGTQVQTGNSNMSHIAGAGFPLVGKELGVSRAEQLSVRMRNVLARFDFNVTNTTSGPIVVKGVEFTATTEITGDFVGDITSDNISWSAQKGASKKVRLTVNNAASIAAGAAEQFYAGVLPFTIPAGSSLKAKVTATDANNNEVVFYHLFEIQSTTGINAGMTYTFSMNFDANHSIDPAPEDPSQDDPGQQDPDKENQELSFAYATVTWQLGNGYTKGNSYDVQAVNGARTNVTYTSGNTNVATISGNRIIIVDAGETTITANAVGNDIYNPASTSYRLVISQSSTGGNAAYVKVTRAPENGWEGTYLIVDDDSSMAFAAFSDNASNYAVGVTISNGQIVANSTVNKYAFTVTDAGVAHENSSFSGQEAYNLRNSEGSYIFGSSSEVYIGSTNQKASQSSSSSTMNTYYSVFKYSNGGVQVASAVQSSGSYRYYLGYTDGAFNYGGGSNVTESHTSRRLQLYKLQDGGSSSSKQNQNLSFSQSSVTVSMNNYPKGSTLSVQQVSGAQTSVTYTSSNTNVATISGTTLTIQGAGETIITANAASSNTYNAASKEYRLVVTEASSTPSGTERTYTYQSSVSAGTYLLGGYESSGSQYSIALFPTVLTGSWESSQGSVSNGQYIAQRDIDSSNTLTFTNDSEIFNAEVELIASGSNWKIKVKSTGQYLVAPTADNRIVYTDSESSATAFSISGGSSYGSSGNGMGVSSGSYYFYHSGSAHGFSMRAYQVTNIRLYKLTSEGGSSSSKQNQNLSFSQSSVTVSMNNYPKGSALSVQQVSGAQTSVTYTSSNTNVATISGTTLTIQGAGETIIYANAASSSTYNAASVSYRLVVTDASSTPVTGDATYVKASSLTVGGTYLIVSEDDTKLFKGATDGSYISISPASGVITGNSYSGYEFTITQSNSKYCIRFNDGKYLLCDYSTSGNSTTGLVYESSQPSSEYLYSLTVTGERFEFMTAQRNSSSTSEVLYYKPESMGGTGPDKFKIGGSGVGIGVHLYLKTSSGSSKKTQSPYFSQSSVTRTMETASGTLSVQTLQNAYGNVTYSSNNSSVATISGTTITIHGFGRTTITGTAAGNDEYYSGSSTYDLYINRVSQEGVYNLENDLVYNYLNEATALYTAANHSDSNGTLIKSNNGWGSSGPVYSYNGVDYTPSKDNRWDCPKPVTITWSSALSGNKSVYVYTDAAHTQQVSYIENPLSVSSSSNSAEIFNLIPGITYYYVVRNGSSDVASGNFTTEGRRRMMKISSSFSQDHANNCRDLGGQITTSGKRIKYGKIYRGSNMDQTANTNPDEQKILKQYMKIELDVDLRGSDRKDALGFGHEINNMDDSDYRGHTNEYYNSSSDLRNNDQRMGATLTRIMRAVHNNVNVYVHCMVGADRTGFTCMMLEALLGVPLERCDMDYEMTSFSVVGTRPRNGRSVSHYNDGVDAINGRSGSTYQEKAIDYAVNYLGMSRDIITQFQNDMLE